MKILGTRTQDKMIGSNYSFIQNSFFEISENNFVHHATSANKITEFIKRLIFLSTLIHLRHGS